MFRRACMTAWALALAAGSASATIETRDLTITNNMEVAWTRIIFYFSGPVLSPAPEFLALRFVDAAGAHTASQEPVDVYLLPGWPNNRVLFDYTPYEPLGSGGTFEFTLTVDNPYNVPFDIGWRTSPPHPIPSPIGSGVLVAAGLWVCRRRR